MARVLRAIIWIAVVAVAIVAIHHSMSQHQQKPVDLSYGDFVQKMQARQVDSLTVDAKSSGTGEFHDVAGKHEYSVSLPDDKKTYLDLATKYIGKNVRFDNPTISEAWYTSLFSSSSSASSCSDSGCSSCVRPRAAATRPCRSGAAAPGAARRRDRKSPSTMSRAWMRSRRN